MWVNPLIPVILLKMTEFHWKCCRLNCDQFLTVTMFHPLPLWRMIIQCDDEDDVWLPCRSLCWLLLHIWCWNSPSDTNRATQQITNCTRLKLCCLLINSCRPSAPFTWPLKAACKKNINMLETSNFSWSWIMSWMCKMSRSSWVKCVQLF